MLKNDLIRQASERIAVAGRAHSGRSVICQVSEESVLAPLALRSRVPGLALAAELAAVVDGAGAGEVPFGRRALAGLARLAGHGLAVKSGSA